LRYNATLNGIEEVQIEEDIHPEKAMRKNIIQALKSFYPRYRAYNGGYLALVREADPDLFMRVLTQLEQEGIIEYNDTQIALRLSDKYMKAVQELAYIKKILLDVKRFRKQNTINRNT